MVSWKQKCITRLNHHECHAVWNYNLSLFAIMKKDNIVISRSIDTDEVVNSFDIPNYIDILGLQWEPKGGNLLTVTWKNGLVKIYSNDGELVGTILMGRNEFTMKEFRWDKLKWNLNEPEFDENISLYLPQLVKVKFEQQKFIMSPFNNMSFKQEWNANLNNNESNIFLTFDNLTKKLAISIDGTFNIKFGDKNNRLPSNVSKILPWDHNNGKRYVVMNDEWQFQIIDLEFTHCRYTKELMKSCSDLQFLLKLLKETYNLIKIQVIDPHLLFIKSIIPDKILQEDILQLFYTGIDDTGKMCNLFKKLGTNGISKWKQLNQNLWNITIDIFTSSIIPILERIILAINRMDGIIKSMKILKFGWDNDLNTPEIDNALSTAKNILGEVVNKISIFKIGGKLSELGLSWIDYMHEIYSDNNSSTGHNFPPKYFEIEKFLQEYIVPNSIYRWIELIFKSLETFSSQFDLIQKNYTTRWIKRQMKTIGPIKKLKELQNDDILDCVIYKDILILLSCSVDKKITRISNYYLTTKCISSKVIGKLDALIKDGKFSSISSSFFLLIDTEIWQYQFIISEKPDDLIIQDPVIIITDLSSKFAFLDLYNDECLSVVTDSNDEYITFDLC